MRIILHNQKKAKQNLMHIQKILVQMLYQVKSLFIEPEQSENIFMQKDASLDFENLSEKSTNSFKVIPAPLNFAEIYEFDPLKGPE